VSWDQLIIGSIHIYLAGLTLRVGSSSSSVITSICGVPQGFVLGPVLFSIYISPIAHIASLFNVCQQQYADDTQLLLSISASNIENGLFNLQQCLLSQKLVAS